MATEIENTQAAQALIAEAMMAEASGNVVGAATFKARAAALAPWLFQKKDSGIPTWAWIVGAIGLGWILMKGR